MIKLAGFVASAPGFTGQSQVINGGSEFFGENGRHARSAIGMVQLPLGAPVELEVIVAADGRWR